MRRVLRAMREDWFAMKGEYPMSFFILFNLVMIWNAITIPLITGFIIAQLFFP